MRKHIKQYAAAAMAAMMMVSAGTEGVYNVLAHNTEVKFESIGSESVYTDGTQLSAVTNITSPKGTVTAKLWTDTLTGRYFYSGYLGEKCLIEASSLGIVTDKADFTSGAEYVAGSVTQVTDTYILLNGKHDGQIDDKCNEYNFTLKKDGHKLTVSMRVYDEGIAYRYSMDEGTSISGEASEFVLPDDAVIWTYNQPNNTYEGTYGEIPISTIYNAAAAYTTPTLAKTEDGWILMTEASVFDKENSYCASYFLTEKDSKNLKWTFGNKQSSKVVMTEAFETPWRVAVMSDNLNEIVNSDIVTSVCNDEADIDWSFVKPGKLAWSWWSSTGDDPIAYEPQFEYIDFAAANGWEYVCLDYGWVLWDDYKDKVKELVDYASEKGVGIWLWYGVNNVGHSGTGAYPTYSLLDKKTISLEMEWANQIGIKGVKVDYYESDSQTTMNQMYMCAQIAAENQIMVLFHGCTSPGGENRTFPNVLSYEAVYGAEYYKWRKEPSTSNIITYLFTRNAVGSADFTPTAMPVSGIDATYGFMLGTSIYIESGLVHFAENINVYEGYAGLSLMNDMPVTWDETQVLEGYPKEYGTVARRSENNWYMASLTTKARTTDISLNFLESGKEYTIYIYKSNADDTNIEVEQIKVTSDDRLKVELKNNDGFAAKITEEDFDILTDYEKNYEFYEAENAVLNGAATLSANLGNAQYSSGGQLVENIGYASENNVTYTINTEDAGVYELNIYYVSGNDRRFLISLNGDENSRIRTAKLNSGDWVTVKKETLYVHLEKGENKITFYNENGIYAPNLDRISLSKAPVDKEPSISDETEDVHMDAETEKAAAYEYSIYEAEEAVIANGATKESTCVGWIGGNSYVLFENIKVEKTGTYYLKISYMTGADRDFAISVNGGENLTITCPSSGDYYTNPASIYMKVELNEGVNTIKMSNPAGDAPNLDSIGISTSVIDHDKNVEVSEDNSVIIVIIVCVVLAIGVIIVALKSKRKKL